MKQLTKIFLLSEYRTYSRQSSYFFLLFHIKILIKIFVKKFRFIGTLTESKRRNFDSHLALID